MSHPHDATGMADGTEPQVLDFEPPADAAAPSPPTGPLAQAMRWWYLAEAGVAVLAFTVVALALIADVLGRELYSLFHDGFGMTEFAQQNLGGIFGAQRTAVHATQVAGMIGFALVVAKGGHLRPTIIDKLTPPAWDPLINRLADLISALICFWLAWMCAQFVQSTAANREISMVFQVQIWPFQLILPYVFLSGGLRFLVFAAAPAHRPLSTGLEG